MILVIKFYDYKIKIELVVGWLEVELMRVSRELCCQCCVMREPGLSLTAIMWIVSSCVWLILPG